MSSCNFILPAGCYFCHCGVWNRPSWLKLYSPSPYNYPPSPTWGGPGWGAIKIVARLLDLTVIFNSPLFFNRPSPIFLMFAMLTLKNYPLPSGEGFSLILPPRLGKGWGGERFFVFLRCPSPVFYSFTSSNIFLQTSKTLAAPSKSSIFGPSQRALSGSG